MNRPGDRSEFVAILTPKGRGAIATVLMQSEHWDQVLDQLFLAKSGKSAGDFGKGQIVYGTWLSAADKEPDSANEDLVVCRVSEHRVEIHCHGGVAAPLEIVRSLESVGLKQITWQDVVVQSEPDGWIAEAKRLLPHVMTNRTCDYMLAQAAGVASDEIRYVLEAIGSKRTDEATEHLENILQYAEFGLHLVNPWKVVIAGPPNAGKSSLINRLLGYGRTIVFNTPGTTRDVVTELTAVHGWPISVSDTAGLRTTHDELESVGIEKAAETIDNSDLLLQIHDVTQPWNPQQEQLLNQSQKSILLLNKSDLDHMPSDLPGIKISALTGQGIDQLMDAISNRLIPNVPAVDQPLIIAEWQFEVIQKAMKQLAKREFDQSAESLKTSSVIGRSLVRSDSPFL